MYRSGSNRLVLLENDGMTGYQQVHGRTLGTIQAAAALIIEGIGSLGICSIAMHVPEASANLLPTDLYIMLSALSNLVKAKANIFVTSNAIKELTTREILNLSKLLVITMFGGFQKL